MERAENQEARGGAGYGYKYHPELIVEAEEK